ncbi:hypothetical protein [Cyclobacterium marinum]|uniref:Lipoprotein n=1 Tax=Cyclobacterium marinum (strain ATCC 25205 / DSM 745 / LMG 13164 / NCIMB 1802) TaxID=880070 RepID=G0IV01_CYCMS|nr:hypothetical protein [Cyclobacterium marinum]AEL26225.1 hypothetical protein Cycma_2484 [Cyclobacterium marinum DSM 745]
MKKQMIKSKFRKSSMVFLGAILGASAIFTSCNEDETPSSTIITEEDAYEVIEGTLIASTYGLTETVEQASTTVAEEAINSRKAPIECDSLYALSFSASKSFPNRSYDYNVEGSYKLNCNSNGESSSFEFENYVTGTYDRTRMSSQDSFESDLIITGLDPSQTNSIINGSYERKGTQQSKVRNERSFSSQVTYTLKDLAIDKSLHEIEGGTAQINVLLTAEGKSKTFSANLTFHGDNTASLEIGDNTYTIDLD